MRDQEFNSVVDSFKTISKDKFSFDDLTKYIEDFKAYDEYSQNKYL